MLDLDGLLPKLGITDWDWVVVADGSGTTLDNTCGWGTVVMGRSGRPRVLHGALSNGTNIMAEVMGVVTGLTYLYNNLLDSRMVGTKIRCVTDCQIVTQPESWKKYRDLAAWLRFYAREGLEVTMHWVDRNSFPVCELCHHIANAARVSSDQAGDLLKDGLSDSLLAWLRSCESPF